MKPLHIVAIAALAGSIASGAVQTLFSARADQSERVPPTTGIFTGPAWSQKVGDAFRSVSTGNKGNTAPANVGGSTVDGLEWIDDTSTPWIKKRYVNGGWAVEGALDPATSSYIGVIGGGSASIASASGPVIDLGSVPQANVTITGTSPITGFGSSAPAFISKIIRFDNALVITHSASLTVPGGFPLTTAAGDRATVTHLGSGNWEITQFTRASGIPIDVAALGKTEFTQAVSVPALHVAGFGQALSRAAYPAYFAKTTRAQNGTRTSGNATISGVADTSGFGAGMPVESTGVNAGCTIASLVANTSITLNSSACVTASGTSTLTVFPHGYGTSGDGTTVGVDDCRNKVLAGRDRSDPGSLAGLLTSTYFGANSAIFGATGGGESKSLLLTHLPPIVPAGTISVTNGAITIAGNFVNSAGGNLLTGGGSVGNFANPTASQATSTATFTGTTGGGSSTPFRTVQPTLIVECIVRVIP